MILSLFFSLLFHSLFLLLISLACQHLIQTSNLFIDGFTCWKSFVNVSSIELSMVLLLLLSNQFNMCVCVWCEQVIRYFMKKVKAQSQMRKKTTYKFIRLWMWVLSTWNVYDHCCCCYYLNFSHFPCCSIIFVRRRRSGIIRIWCDLNKLNG